MVCWWGRSRGVWQTQGRAESKTCFHEFVWPFFRTPPPPPRVSQWQERRGANVVTPVKWAQRTEESKGGLGLGGAVCGVVWAEANFWVRDLSEREIRDLVWSETEDTEDTRAAHDGDIPGGWHVMARDQCTVSRSQIRSWLTGICCLYKQLAAVVWKLNIGPCCHPDVLIADTQTHWVKQRSLIDSILTPELR